jgi:uncharacterized protein YjbI with pentapeptide repeats
MTDESVDERRKATKEALEKCSETVNRAMLSLLAVSLFCLLTTFGASDRSLVAPEATIKVPFADAPISFVGFLVVAPLLLFVLTIYLHVFYGYWRQLDCERRAQGLTETYPTLFSIDRRIARLFTAFIFYWLVPFVAATITWKAAARFEWGLPMAVVTVLVTTGLLFLQSDRHAARRLGRVRAVRLWLVGLLMLATVTVGVLRYADYHARVSSVVVLPRSAAEKTEYWERPLDLFRTDLKDAWLVRVRLRDAKLQFANLTRAKLGAADLTGAYLTGANLTGADLNIANLRSANLVGANLTGAELSLTDFGGTKLIGANLRGAGLILADLRGADLSRADLAGARLADARVTGANLTGTDLTGADLRDVQGLTCDQLRAAKTDKATKLPVSMVCSKQ